MSMDIKETTTALYPRVVAGDTTASGEMIEVNMPVVGLKVNDLLQVCPHFEYLRDDLVGEGNLALVEAVARIARGDVKNTNITSYLWTAVMKSIGNFIDEELFSDTSGRTVRSRRSAGVDQTPSTKAPNSDFVLGNLEYDPRGEAELLDLIQGCCESDEERAIVDLRIKGYVDSEIARQLDIPKTTVFMLRRELYQRVLATGEVTPD